MRSGHLVSLVGAAVLFGGFGCAGVTPKANGDGGPAARAARAITSTAAMPDIPTIEVGNLSMCGNGVMDPGESCDDGNKTPGDGCSAICQMPAGWTCTGSPSVCNMAGVCGDGILGASEACDDMNTDGRRRLLG